MPKLNSSTVLHAQTVILAPITTYIEWLFIYWFGLSIALHRKRLDRVSQEREEHQEECYFRCYPSSRKKETEWASNQPRLLYRFNVVIPNLLDVAKGCETTEGSIVLDELKPLYPMIFPNYRPAFIDI
jgi:hypothetical protein